MPIRPSKAPFHLAAFLCAMLAELSTVLPARGGTLSTLDGKSYDGELRLGDTQAIITPKSGPPVRIEFANILYASINAPVPPSANADRIGGFSAQAIGKFKNPADVLFFNGFYSFRGNGEEIAGKTDNFHYYSRSVDGDGEISARLIDLSAGARAGLMYREDRQPDARHACLLVDAKGELSFRFRTESGQNITKLTAGKVSLPVYLRLVRGGRQFSGYKSADGITWDLAARVYDEERAPEARGKAGASLPSTPLPGIIMPSNSLIGLAFCGGETPGTSGSSEDSSGSAILDQVIIREQYYAPFSQTPAPPGPAKYAGAPGEALLKGILLQSGTFLAKSSITPADKSRIGITLAGRARNVDLAQVARIQFQDLSPSILTRIPPQTQGVILSTGDFMEGAITNFDRERIEISNITLGLASYRLDGQVQAVILRDASATPAGFRLRLADGSLLVARALKANDKGELEIQEYALGNLTLPLKDILSIQGAADHVSSLMTLHPSALEAPPGGDVDAINCFLAGNIPWLAAGGMLNEQGIIAPAGASVSFRLPAGSKAFACRLAVPERLPEKATVRFTLLADGKEIYRSAELSSRTPPVPIHVSVDQVKMLTLRIESASKLPVPAFGLWANPLLIR